MQSLLTESNNNGHFFQNACKDFHYLKNQFKHLHLTTLNFIINLIKWYQLPKLLGIQSF